MKNTDARMFLFSTINITGTYGSRQRSTMVSLRESTVWSKLPKPRPENTVPQKTWSPWSTPLEASSNSGYPYETARNRL